MARRPAIAGAAVAPDQVVRARDAGAPFRLALILLLLNLLLGSAVYYYLTELSPSGVDLVMADTPVDVMLPGDKKPRKVTTSANLPPGTLVLTRAVPRSALRFSSVNLRLAPRTRLRILRGGPLATSGVEVALEAGRVWIERDSQWVPIVVRVGPERIRPGVGSTEIRREPPVILGWTATAWIEDPDEREIFQVDLGEGGKKTAEQWLHVRIPGLVDAWTAWNMHTTGSDILSGEVMDMEVAHRLERPPEFVIRSPQRPAPHAPRPQPELALDEVDGPSEPERRSPEPPIPPPIAGLPGPGYPRGPGGISHAPRGGFDPAPPRPREPGAPPPPPPLSVTTGGRSSGGGYLTWQPPDRLTTGGRDEPPGGAVDLTAAKTSVKSRDQARRLQDNVERILVTRFGMELRQPFQMVAAGSGDKDVALQGYVSRVMALKNQDGVWVAKIADGVHEDEFAVWGAAMYAGAWLKEQGLDDDADAQGFTRWISYKYAIAAGHKDQARSIPKQSAATSAWVDNGTGKGFDELWELEGRSGERGVFDKLLESEEDRDSYRAAEPSR